MGSRHVLSRWEVRAIYDRVGAWQDTQAVYEVPAFDKLVEHGRFEDARAVFEVGCGTGRFAERLLRDHCPLETRYEGVDLSSTMVRTARERLTSFGERATVRRTDGALTFDRPDESQDRIVITYVLDLLSRDDARMLLNEAHRLLGAQGRLCLAGLTGGCGLLSRGISRAWDVLHRMRPEWVGGCRPVRVRSLLRDAQWHEEHHRVVTAWGVPSEVLVATPA